MSRLPAAIRERYRPPVAKRIPANDHRPAWAGRGHVGAFLVQLLGVILANLAVWGLILWSAIRYAERGGSLPPLGGPL